MPHTPSAWKRLRKNEKRRRQNRAAAKTIKAQRKSADTALKAVATLHAEAAEKGIDQARLKEATAKTETEYRTTQMVLDRAADKGYIHPNKAARLKSRLVKRTRAAATAVKKADEKK
jgi:small subunit ribosomal protein S20